MIGSSIVSSTEDGFKKLAKHAAVVLVVIMVVQLAGAGLAFVAGSEAMQLPAIAAVVSGLFYGALALWARKDPFTAVLVGFVLYVINIGYGLSQGESIFSGILWKAILLALFLNGLAAGRQYNEAKRHFARKGG